jgi:hypothetical protein
MTLNKNIREKKSLTLILILFNFSFLNAQNNSSKETTLKKPDLNEVTATFRYVLRDKTISGERFIKLSENSKSKYDSIVNYNDFGVFKENLGEYIDKYYITKDACVQKNLNSEKKKYGLSPVDSVLSFLEFSNIQKLGFTLKPLGQEVEEIIKGIKHIKGKNMNAEWLEAHSNGIPAYCTHRDDGELRYGVLLNPHAIKILNDILKSDSKYWRIPEIADFDFLNKMVTLKGASAFDLLAGDRSKFVGNFKWSKPGMDVFEMGLMPWGFKLNSDIRFNNDKKSCSIAMINSDDNADFKNKIAYASLDENAKTFNLKTRELGSDDAYGFYVILFRNVEFKLND